MAREFPRTRRVGEQMRRELTALIRSEIDDPRMAMVSITSVEVSRDFAHAKVYVTILGDPAGREGMVAALNHAAPMLRHGLGRLMRIRTIPQLAFRYDETVERGAHLYSLIAAAVAADAARHRDDHEE